MSEDTSSWIKVIVVISFLVVVGMVIIPKIETIGVEDSQDPTPTVTGESFLGNYTLMGITRTSRWNYSVMIKYDGDVYVYHVEGKVIVTLDGRTFKLTIGGDNEAVIEEVN